VYTQRNNTATAFKGFTFTVVTISFAMAYTSQLPILFLYPLQHEGKAFIRIWHLREASWIRYSKTYKCFAMHHSLQTIEITHQHL
jgi:hypothetical protein